MCVSGYWCICVSGCWCICVPGCWCMCFRVLVHMCFRMLVHMYFRVLVHMYFTISKGAIVGVGFFLTVIKHRHLAFTRQLCVRRVTHTGMHTPPGPVVRVQLDGCAHRTYHAVAAKRGPRPHSHVRTHMREFLV